MAHTLATPIFVSEISIIMLEFLIFAIIVTAISLIVRGLTKRKK